MGPKRRRPGAPAPAPPPGPYRSKYDDGSLPPMPPPPFPPGAPPPDGFTADARSFAPEVHRVSLRAVRELRSRGPRAGTSVDLGPEPAWLSHRADASCVVAVLGGTPTCAFFPDRDVLAADALGDVAMILAVRAPADGSLLGRDESEAEMRASVEALDPDACGCDAFRLPRRRTLTLAFHDEPDRDATLREFRQFLRVVAEKTELSTERREEENRRALVGLGQGASLVTPRLSLDSSAEYFRYYGLISQQENMLRDDVRTGTYRAAMSERSRAAFAGKIVVDVGCGSGVLSFFAASAGARRVYAIEASEMAAHAAALVDADPRARDVVRVVRGRAEDFADFDALARAAGDDPDDSRLFGVSSTREGGARGETRGGPGRLFTGKQQHHRKKKERLGKGADVIVSEPMGTALFNERMVETFVRARDQFGRRDVSSGVPVPEMFPRLGRLHAAPFADDALWAEMDAKGAFWAEGKDAHGVDVTPLAGAARRAYFRQCVIDAFAPGVLRADRPCSFEWDFARLEPEALEAIEMPLRFEGVRGGVAHGVALWFDVEFATAAEKTAEAKTGKSTSRFLSTAPGLPTTHWYQMRLVFETPLAIDHPEGEAGATVRGNLRLTARDDRSYDAEATLETEGGGERETARGTWDLKDPYYRQTLFPQPGYTKAQTARWYGTET